MLADAAIGVFAPGKGERQVIASGDAAAKVWAAGIEEWKLLSAAALIGLSKEALAMAADYACERIAFGMPIEIGRASSRERVCQDVEKSAVDVSYIKKMPYI